MKTFLISLMMVLVFSTPAHAFKFAAVGDFNYNAAFKNTLDNIHNQETVFTMALGDFSYDTVTPTVWCNEIKTRLGSQYPFQLVMGNHDTEHETDYMTCLPDRMDSTGSYGRQSYFDHEEARFITIDPAITSTDPNHISITSTAGKAWLKGLIDEAKAEDKWVIVSMHKNCVSMGTQGCDISAGLMNDLVNWHVDLIFQGHEHGYMRSKQFYPDPDCWITSQSYDADCMRATTTYPIYPAGGTHLVINGTGGTALRNIDLNAPDKGYFRTWSGLNVNPAHGPSTVEVSANELHVLFSTNADGVLDDFRIVRSQP